MGTPHISLYLALFQLWCNVDHKSDVHFSSRDVMPLAKIYSSATYHKCLKDLVEAGYVGYVPSCDPYVKNIAVLAGR